MKILRRWKNFYRLLKNKYEHSTLIQEAGVIIETDRKIFNKVKGTEYGKGNINFAEKVVVYQRKNCYIPGERASVSLVVFRFYA